MCLKEKIVLRVWSKAHFSLPEPLQFYVQSTSWKDGGGDLFEHVHNGDWLFQLSERTSKVFYGYILSTSFFLLKLPFKSPIKISKIHLKKRST